MSSYNWPPQGSGGGSGTVTSVSVVTANGVSGSVATATTTPAITLTLGAITPASVAAAGTVTGSNLSGTNTGDVTLGTANGLSLAAQALSLQAADGSHTGALTSVDWTTFNSKQSALTLGNLTDAGTDGITVTGGTGAVIGSGTSIAQHVADTTHNGYLSSADWNTFNGKGSGTVTAVSVASANGFAGSSSGGATPALTLSTSITGVLKGNGTAISAATSGTDYSAGTSALATGIIKSTTTTGVLTIAVAGDFPTLNQNTSGTAAGLSATLVVASGGTGVASTTAYAVLCGGTTTTAPIQSVASVGSSGQVLTSNGASALPTFQSVAAGNLSVVSKSTTYAASSSDNMILVDDSGGSWTLTLPTAVGISGHTYIVTRTNSGLTTATTIATTSAQTVGGYASGVVKLTTGNESYQLVSDGANWSIASHKNITPWTSYSPTLTNLGTTSNVSAYWRRVGDSCQVRMLLTCGTVGATQPQFGLPSAITIASSKLPSGLGDGGFVGTLGWNGSGVNGTSTIIATAGQTYFRAGVQNATNSAVNSAQNGSVWTGNATVAFYGEAPIVDWLE